MMFDYGTGDVQGAPIPRDDLRRLASAGADSLLVIADTAREQVSDTQFDFSLAIERATDARDAGFTSVRFIAPTGAPTWIPDEWWLQNMHGHRSHMDYGFSPRLRTGTSHWRVTSYWNDDAEQYQRNYIQEFRRAVEPLGAQVIAVAGPTGESFFPCDKPIRNVLGQEFEMGPWYYDPYATMAWQSSGIPDRHEWWHRERIEILRERLEWSSEPWLLNFEFCDGYDGYRRGNDGIAPDILQLTPRPTRVMFTLFRWDIMAKVRKTPYFSTWRAWVGAEGAQGLVKHAHLLRYFEYDVEGMLCGPLFDKNEGVIDGFTFSQIEKAVKIC